MTAVSLPLLQAHLERALGPDLLSSAYRSHWSEANPTAGLCSVACEAAWFVLGGPSSEWVPHVVRDGDQGWSLPLSRRSRFRSSKGAESQPKRPVGRTVYRPGNAWSDRLGKNR